MAFSWETLYTFDHTTAEDAITDLRYRVNEDSEDLVTDAQILTSMKDALRSMSMEAQVNFGVASDTIASGTTEYELPANIGEIYDIVVVNNNYPISLVPTNEADAANMYDYNWYYRKGNIIVVSSSTSSGTIKLYAQKKPTVPTLTTDYIELPEEHMEVFYTYLEFMYWKRAREFEEMSVTKKIYDSYVQKVLEDKDKYLPSGSYGYGQKS